MLRQVFITKAGKILYKRKFGKALDDEGFQQAYKQIAKEAFQIKAEKNRYHDYFQYRINYLSIPEKEILFLFVSDLSDKFENVKKELERCRKEFMNLFGEMLDEDLDADSFEIFNPTMDLIHKNLRPKISLVGFSGVGKTTITRLITAEDIPVEHVPTITGDIGTIKIGKLHFHLWDFAGQEQFSFLWNNFIKGSDAVLLITDSTLENCEKSKYFTELIKKEAPYAHTAVIGNKQDLPEAMPIADIERILEMKAYSMIAVDPDNRDKMITIIADILEMSGEVSPLLKPLLKRDEKVKEAEEAIENGNFENAVHIFEELADLSLELGDDRVSQDFQEKAEKIRSILQKSQTTPQPTPQPTPPISTPEEGEAEKIPEKPPVSKPKEEPIAQEQEMPPKPPVKIPPTPKEITTEAKPTSPSITAPKPEATSVNPPPKPEGVSPPKPEVVVPPKPPVKAPPAPPKSVVATQKEEKKEIKLQPPSIPKPPKASPTKESPQEQELKPEVPEKPEQKDQLGALLQKLKAKKQTGSTMKAPPKPPRGSVLGQSNKFAQLVSAPPAPPSSSSTETKMAPPVKDKTATVPPPHPSKITESSAKPSQTPSSSANSSAKMITELKIKMANVNKTLLDLEMDNITGDLSDEDFEKKSQRLEAMKQKILQQIEDLKSL